MSHIRTQIRAALAQQLDAIAAVTGRVHPSRPSRIDPACLPCIAISAPAEEIERLGISVPYLYQRGITLLVEVYVALEPLEATADDLAADVERAIAQAGRLGGGLVQKPLELTATRLEVDDTVSPPMAMARLAYLATVLTASDTPDAAA